MDWGDLILQQHTNCLKPKEDLLTPLQSLSGKINLLTMDGRLDSSATYKLLKAKGRSADPTS
jgi:hypothetical protein